MKSFIENFLAQADVNWGYICKMTSNDNIVNLFVQACTHPSYDTTCNFDVFEFYGDRILNVCITSWMNTKLSDITSMNWLNKIKSYLFSTSVVSRLARHLGIHKYLRYTTIDKTGDADEDFNICLDDALESVFAVVCKSFELIGMETCIGIHVCQNVVTSFFNSANIEQECRSWDIVCDPKTRLKEIYDNAKWPFGIIKQDSKSIVGGVRLSVRIWPHLNVHSDPRPEFRPVVQRVVKSHTCKLTPEIINTINNLSRGDKSSKLKYDISTRLQQANGSSFEFAKEQFTSYFGIGIELDYIEGTREHVKQLEDALALKCLKTITSFNIYPSPPPSMVYTWKPQKCAPKLFEIM